MAPSRAPQRREVALSGVVFATAAYLWWGLSPIYWKLLAAVPAEELVAHRVVWSALLLGGFLTVRGRWAEVGAVLRSPRVAATLAATTLLIATNWWTYIWAVNSNHLVEASLGYFVTPLVSVLLGLVVLRERLGRLQIISLVLAAAGVALLTLRLGRMPWISMVLAVSFAFYGLLRKTVRAEPESGLWIETALLAPFALVYLGSLGASGRGAFGDIGFAGAGTTSLLVLSGVITALLLVWFTHGARRLPLSTLGFLQYLAPVLQFALGVAVYREPFSSTHLAAFTLIWAALVLFSVDSHRRWRRNVEWRMANSECRTRNGR
jgi:chloramphenicol-sensitive protein RarD